MLLGEARNFADEGSGGSVDNSGIMVEKRVEGGGFGTGGVRVRQSGGDAPPQSRRGLRHKLLQSANASSAELGGSMSCRLRFFSTGADPVQQARQRLIDPQLPDRFHGAKSNAGVRIIEQLAKGLIEPDLAVDDFAQD